MTIYSRTNLPERIVKEAVHLVVDKSVGPYKPRGTIELIDIENQIYSVIIPGYPKINIELRKNDAMVKLAEENNWYQNMRTGEESDIYFI